MLGPRWDQPVSVAIDVTLIGRFYERFADHAVNVANQVVYQITGEDPTASPARASRPLSRPAPPDAQRRPPGRVLATLRRAQRPWLATAAAASAAAAGSR